MATSTSGSAAEPRVVKATGTVERPNYVRDVNVVRAALAPHGLGCYGFPKCNCGRLDAEAALNRLFALALEVHTEAVQGDSEVVS